MAVMADVAAVGATGAAPQAGSPAAKPLTMNTSQTRRRTHLAGFVGHGSGSRAIEVPGDGATRRLAQRDGGGEELGCLPCCVPC